MSPRPALVLAAAMMGIAFAPAGAQRGNSAWIIQAGSYAGDTVTIDRSLATRKSSRFWRLSNIRNDGRIVAWNPSSLPARVAFGSLLIAADDSTAFWEILRQMEQDMGMHLFEPASLESSDESKDEIVVDLKYEPGTEGKTLITWSTSGAPYDARVFLKSAASLHDSRVVTHEMMHALGFGHTAAWPSVMGPSASGPSRLTPTDVAYAQAAFRSREQSERSDVWERLALAVSREDPRAPVEPPVCVDGVNPLPIELPERGIAELPTGGPRRLSSCFR
jgi:hypothetical protein